MQTLNYRKAHDFGAKRKGIGGPYHTRTPELLPAAGAATWPRPLEQKATSMMKTTAASQQSSTMTTATAAAFPLILPPDRRGERGADGGRNSGSIQAERHVLDSDLAQRGLITKLHRWVRGKTQICCQVGPPRCHITEYTRSYEGNDHRNFSACLQ
jgi:hypothetical protein